MDDQAFYNIVALELKNRYLKSGLWMRAVAETGHEGIEAQALYIKLRVSELINERESLRLRAKLQQKEEAFRREHQQILRRQKRRTVAKFLVVAGMVVAFVAVVWKLIQG
jgi:hypothetical protein